MRTEILYEEKEYSLITHLQVDYEPEGSSIIIKDWKVTGFENFTEDEIPEHFAGMSYDELALNVELCIDNLDLLISMEKGGYA